jgi:hypothetical protein
MASIGISRITANGCYLVTTNRTRRLSIPSAARSPMEKASLARSAAAWMVDNIMAEPLYKNINPTRQEA